MRFYIEGQEIEVQEAKFFMNDEEGFIELNQTLEEILESNDKNVQVAER